MAKIIRQQFEDETPNQSYPFYDFATLVTGEGIQFPKQLFLDACFYPAGDNLNLYMSSVIVGPLKVVFEFSSEDGVIAKAAVANKTNVPDQITVKDQYDRQAGVIIFNPIEAKQLQTLELGVYSFNSDSAKISQNAIIPMPEETIRGFIVNGEIFSEHVKFVGEDGVYFTEEDGVVRVDVIGDPYFLRKNCEDEGVNVENFDTGPYLKTINGEAPNENGDFFFAIKEFGNELTVLRIQPQSGGLLIKLIGANT